MALLTKMLPFFIFFISCNIIEIKQKPLIEHSLKNGKKFKVCFIYGNATVNDNIQVRKSENDSVIWVSEKYDYLVSSFLKNDSLLELVLSDSIFLDKIKMIKPDTILINLK